MYAQSQAYPYAMTLDPNFVRTSGGQLALGTPAGQAAIFPGAVMKKLVNEVVTLSTSADAAGAFGLSANFVGGTMDDLFDQSNIGVWRGRNSVFEVLAPAFDDTGLSAQAGGGLETAGTGVKLTNTATGLLSYNGGTLVNPVARLMSRLSPNAIIVELLT